MAAAARPPFFLGKKEVFLPTFKVVLHRTNHLGPRYATFTVPLWFNKLDLRDYLYNVYSVRILSIRSYIKLRPMVTGLPLRLHDERYSQPQQGRYRRLKSIKRMTVELEQPFQWPDEPEDRTPWQGEHFEKVDKEQKDYEEREGRLKDAYVDKARNKSIAEQAKDLLSGKTQWRPTESMNQGATIPPSIDAGLTQTLMQRDRICIIM